MVPSFSKLNFDCPDIIGIATRNVTFALHTIEHQDLYLFGFFTGIRAEMAMIMDTINGNTSLTPRTAALW